MRGSGRIAALLVCLGLGGGCQTPLAPTGLYDYFAKPSPDDAWSIKIRGWQERERVDSPDPSSPAEEIDPAKLGDLNAKYDAFREERRVELARSLAQWIQEQARTHYIPDGPIDHWATFDETMRHNGDDCDGLELLVFHFLRELGFPKDQVYRAIVVRRSDGQHHMVTLWFEDKNDPWVIDPTGAMTSGMPHMSQMADWVPIKVFTDVADWTVHDGRFAAAPH